MLSVTEIVFIGVGSGVLVFIFVPCCAYWFGLCDVTRFSRHRDPLNAPVENIQRFGII